MPKVSVHYQRRQRKRILVAAESCFADDGFHAASMDQIVSRAGMSSSTVYSYFPGGKRELVRAVCENRLDPLYARIEEYAERETPPSPSQVFEEIFGNLWEIPFSTSGGQAPGATRSARLAVNVWSEVNRDEDLRKLMMDRHRTVRKTAGTIVRRWQEQGQVDPGLDPDEVVATIIAVYFGVIVDYVISGKFDSAEVIKALENVLRPRG